MIKKIKRLLIGLLAISSIAQAEHNNITSSAKALAVGFGSGFGAIVVPYPAISLATPAILSNAYDREHVFSRLEKSVLTGSAITGAITAIGVWYKAGQCISNALWGTDIGRYIAIIPAIDAALMAGLAYYLSKIEIRTANSPRINSHFQDVTSSESVAERA